MNRLRGIAALALAVGLLLVIAVQVEAARGGRGQGVGPPAASQGQQSAAQELVTICHKPGTPAEQTLQIAAPAVAAHLRHGDLEGACQPSQAPIIPPPTSSLTVTVTICHKPGTPAEKTLEVPQVALRGHLRHGDQMGPCPEPTPEAVLTPTQAYAAVRARARMRIRR